MMKNHLIGVALVAFLTGCCGVGLPSEEKARQWLAPLTPGTLAEEAVRLLAKKGFDPTPHEYQGSHYILGQRTSSCLGFTDYLKVTVTHRRPKTGDLGRSFQNAHVALSFA
jgi:hypothetical protein